MTTRRSRSQGQAGESGTETPAPAATGPDAVPPEETAPKARATRPKTAPPPTLAEIRTEVREIVQQELASVAQPLAGKIERAIAAIQDLDTNLADIRERVLFASLVSMIGELGDKVKTLEKQLNEQPSAKTVPVSMPTTRTASPTSPAPTPTTQPVVHSLDDPELQQVLGISHDDIPALSRAGIRSFEDIAQQDPDAPPQILTDLWGRRAKRTITRTRELLNMGA